ncbi:MAG TPA: deoxyhypusine synthase [Candidatus Krumholzibacteriaceae bacterium]|nr:deoxyhypusine synthase [Candidatus Krumholzibacteriaceae bacterium]
MKKVKHMRVRKGLSAEELVEQMQRCGVLGAGKIGKATELTAKMFGDPDYTVFLTLAGALVPGGLRSVISDLIREEYVNVLVTTGANMVHDMVEALGYSHYIGTFQAEDARLKAERIGRIGDIYVQQQAFEALEKWLDKALNDISENERQRIAPSTILNEIGKRIRDKDSILANAARRNVPIICPGLADSIAGFQLWMFSQDKKLVMDSLLDVKKLVEIVYEAKKAGIIILGGGWPKHFTLFANTFREGVDSAVQITMDRPEPGGLSGASLDEAISWSKVRPKGGAVTVVCDATIAFPLIVAAALSKL